LLGFRCWGDTTGQMPHPLSVNKDQLRVFLSTKFPKYPQTTLLVISNNREAPFQKFLFLKLTFDNQWNSLKESLWTCACAQSKGSANARVYLCPARGALYLDKIGFARHQSHRNETKRNVEVYTKVVDDDGKVHLLFSVSTMYAKKQASS
jgi:hypothetical protein